MLGVRTAPEAGVADLSIDGLEPAVGGGEVSIHYLGGDDEAALEEVFSGLSPAGRFGRYHTGTPSLPSGSRKLLRRVDGIDVMALVARNAPGEAVGLVWVIRTGDGVAELAIEVVDAWQRRGVGSKLLRAAEAAAATMGIRSLKADVLGTNRAAVGLLLKAAPHVTVKNEGPELIFEWAPAVGAKTAPERRSGGTLPDHARRTALSSGAARHRTPRRLPPPGRTKSVGSTSVWQVPLAGPARYPVSERKNQPIRT